MYVYKMIWKQFEARQDGSRYNRAECERREQR